MSEQHKQAMLKGLALLRAMALDGSSESLAHANAAFRNAFLFGYDTDDNRSAMDVVDYGPARGWDASRPQEVCFRLRDKGTGLANLFQPLEGEPIPPIVHSYFPAVNQREWDAAVRVVVMLLGAVDVRQQPKAREGEPGEADRAEAKRQFIAAVHATADLPAEMLAGATAAGVRACEAHSVSASYLNWLDEQIRLGARGPAWTERLIRRRTALTRFCGERLIYGAVLADGMEFTAEVHPVHQRVIHWEVYVQSAPPDSPPAPAPERARASAPQTETELQPAEGGWAGFGRSDELSAALWAATPAAHWIYVNLAVGSSIWESRADGSTIRIHYEPAERIVELAVTPGAAWELVAPLASRFGLVRRGRERESNDAQRRT